MRMHSGEFYGVQSFHNDMLTSSSALAALENEGAEDTRSPPSEQGSPQTSKATPSIDAAADSAPPS